MKVEYWEEFPLHFTILALQKKVFLIPRIMCALHIAIAVRMLYNEDVNTRPPRWKWRGGSLLFII
jgi:hypothetical protein